ncbi:hypothetical protein BCT35_22790 [Vibrio lentus]|uniref:hypothetical protein n=1 Tax=Vibrio TaxID=662 RepID=UPI00030A41B0|nr:MULTISPECIES: hypothetical protein [Vibrio]PMJ93296.1 hypothetical protein BCU11_06075 [Vibrio cyclitrophicus]PMN28749.1 hypothetical protein BCT35_22790 [Vibrio lentus]CAK1829975.1 conserved membrane hypothetical protein [Vibrio crassostreae]CAK3196959.1 conserved membrane hypothetical protein [Vibrio crassostreae]
MLDLLTDPIVLAVLIGPIAGIIWTKILNTNARKDECLPKGNVKVSNSGTISASDDSNIQIGHGNNVTNHNHNYHSGQPPKSQGEGEVFIFGVLGVIAAILYIRHREWALGFSLLFLLFNAAFTLGYFESKSTKVIKTLAYGVLLYILYSISRSPIDPYYVSVVQALKGQGLKVYIEAIRLDYLPFQVILTAITQAGALFLMVFASHAIRVTSAEQRLLNNLQKIGVMVIALAMPLYLLNFEAVNAQIITFIGEAI